MQIVIEIPREMYEQFKIVQIFPTDKIIANGTPLPEPYEDVVSRQAVLDLIADYDLSMGQVVRGIHTLPSVIPKQRTGKWIKLQHNGDGSSRYMCSECGDTMQLSRHTFATFCFCPKCGAKMEGVGK